MYPPPPTGGYVPDASVRYIPSGDGERWVHTLRSLRAVGPYPPVRSEDGRRRARPRSALVRDDLGEFVGVEAGAADESAVDVGLGHQLGDVRRLHRPAVLDAHRVGGRCVGEVPDALANRPA